MKKLIIILAVIASSCCDKPAPDKIAYLDIVVKKDTLFIRNIKRIYAVGSNLNSSFYNKSSNGFQGNNLIQLPLPISYAFDSTIYILEQKNKVNDTIIIHYQRNIDYNGGDNCGYQQTLSSKQRKHYTTLKKYSLSTSFGTFGTRSGIFSKIEPACEITLNEK